MATGPRVHASPALATGRLTGFGVGALRALIAGHGLCAGTAVAASRCVTVRDVAQQALRQCPRQRRLPEAFRTGDQDRMPKLTHGKRSEEHTSALQSLMRISYAVFCLKKKHIRASLHPYTPTTH